LSSSTDETRSSLRAGRLWIELHRTLRVPDDGRRYPLPPSFGTFPLHRVRRGEFITPLRQWEAMWISFDSPYWRPSAVQVEAGGVNALSGEPAGVRLRRGNYLVSPPQLWLDGVKTAAGAVRQFVAVPLGRGLTVGEQVSGRLDATLRFRVFPPKPGLFPIRAPRAAKEIYLESGLGIGVGGEIAQEVYADPHGLRTWDQSRAAGFTVTLVNSETFTRLTGRRPPPSPISAAEYTRLGLPWFSLYDEPPGTVDPGDALASLVSAGVQERQETGTPRVWRIRHPSAAPLP